LGAGAELALDVGACTQIGPRLIAAG